MSKAYESAYKAGEHEFDVMTYEQKPGEFEGPLKGWIWFDEPPKHGILGACTSRLSEGGIIIITFTPINAGAILDELDDLVTNAKRKGFELKIKEIGGNVYDNDIKTGKLNKKGTKRGLLTKEQIESYVAKIPSGQEEARAYGKATHKSGKVYQMFDKNVHVKDFDLSSEYCKKWNCYMVYDPHDQYYPFAQWWAYTPDDMFILWNEWPTFEFMNNNYYDMIRETTPCPYSPKELSQFIKIQDGADFGIKILKRFVDPRFASKTKAARLYHTKEARPLIQEYAKYKIYFEMPPFERIAVQRTKIMDLLKFDYQRPLGPFNEPKMYLMPHCRNSIRAFERHYWKEKGEVESEEFKDPMDLVRYMLAGRGDIGYQFMEEEKKPEAIKSSAEYFDEDKDYHPQG